MCNRLNGSWRFSSSSVLLEPLSSLAFSIHTAPLQIKKDTLYCRVTARRNQQQVSEEKARCTSLPSGWSNPWWWWDDADYSGWRTLETATTAVCVTTAGSGHPGTPCLCLLSDLVTFNWKATKSWTGWPCEVTPGPHLPMSTFVAAWHGEGSSENAGLQQLLLIREPAFISFTLQTQIPKFLLASGLLQLSWRLGI